MPEQHKCDWELILGRSKADCKMEGCPKKLYLNQIESRLNEYETLKNALESTNLIAEYALDSRDKFTDLFEGMRTENELLREYISAVLEEAIPIIHIHQVRDIGHQAQFPRCTKAWENIPENVRVTLGANVTTSVGIIKEMKPSDDGELLEKEN